ncbi:MAG: TauD/TfdA family dioxygenase [Thalassolituus sp.]|uniref:TauD/TfdA dioxygenase family protein n=1 Tax=Thalassolituus sp. TaxID=2030822 RepID=UPI003981CE6F
MDITVEYASRNSVVETSVQERVIGAPYILTPNDVPIDRAQCKDFIYNKVRDFGFIILRDFDINDAHHFQRFLQNDLSIKTWNVFNKMKVAGPIITFVRRITDGILGAGDNRSYLNSELQQLGRIDNSVQGPHVEGGVYNKRARYLFMYCEEAPATWGETGIADLNSVYKSLSPETQVALQDAWQQFEFTSVKRLNWLERAILVAGRIKHYLRPDEHMQMVMDRIPVLCRHPDNGLLCPQIWAYRGDSVYAAASKTFPERKPLDNECMASTWRLEWKLTQHNGNPISNKFALMDELINATFENSRLVRWQPGDITIVDNIRCAHWRMNGYADQPRKIYQLQAEPFLATDCIVELPN